MKLSLKRFKGILSLSALLTLTISSATLLSSCSSSSGSSISGNAVQGSELVIEKAGELPVLDGNATSSGLYVRNTSNKRIDGISYGINVSGSGTELSVGTNSCRSIEANSSCLLPISTPSLSLGQSGSSEVVAGYEGKQSKQLVNYRYVSSQDYSGVSFSDKSQSLYGTGDYATAYVFVGKGQSQSGVGFTVSNTSLAITSGLTNGKVDIGSNEVVALELSSNQNVTSNLVTITPTIETLSKTSARIAQTNNQLQVTITPTQRANLIMSNIPVLSPSESSAIVTVFNNGNAAASGVNMLSLSPSTLFVYQGSTPCPQTLNAGSSCNYRVQLLQNVYTSGSAQVTLTYMTNSAPVQAFQTVNYQNSKAEPMVSAVATQSSFTEQINTTQSITFNVRNIGNAPLNSVVASVKTSLANTAVTILNNSCPNPIPAGMTTACQIQVSVASSGLIDSGIIYLNLSGTYVVSSTTKSYSFVSKPVSVTITDPTAPTVTSTTPQDSATSVSTSTSITVNFSEPMTSVTLNNSNILLQRESGSINVPLTLQGVTNNNQTVTFTQTSGSLADFTRYKIVINPSQIKDINGNAIGGGSSQLVSTFTTGDSTAPTISNVSPTNGATNQSRTPAITIQFSESMNQSTLTTSNIILRTQAGVVVTGYSISYDPSTLTATVNLNSTQLASETTYQLAVNQTAITDTSGNALGGNANYQISQFTVGDYTAPVLSSTVPVNGATNVAIESSISLTFSESMNTSSLVSPNIRLRRESDASIVGLNAPVYSNGNKTVTFQPTSNLGNNESYSIVIKPNQISDASGNVMSNATESVVSRFRTKMQLYLNIYVTNTMVDTSVNQSGAKTAAGALVNADSICNSDSNKPPANLSIGSMTYKALVWSNGLRTVGIAGWPIRANTTYQTTQNGSLPMVLGTSDNNGVLYELMNQINPTNGGYGFLAGIVVDTVNRTWTGGFNCSNWTDTTTNAGTNGAYYGFTGNWYQPPYWIEASRTYCSNTATYWRLLCVESQ